MDGSEETRDTVLIKSEKKSVRGLIIGLTIAAVVIISFSLIYSLVDYHFYKKGQNIIYPAAVEAFENSHYLDYYEVLLEDKSYTEQMKRLYEFVNQSAEPGTKEYSHLYAIKAAFHDNMQKVGYDRFDTDNVQYWFACTNYFGYITSFSMFIRFGYWGILLFLILYVSPIILLIAALIIKMEAKKEIVVYEDSVLCITNSKKTRKIYFDEIETIEVKLNGIYKKTSDLIIKSKLRFRIYLLTNAEEIKSIIQGKRLELIESLSANNNAELNKYKDMLDSELISKDEYEVKRKEILNN